MNGAKTDLLYKHLALLRISRLLIRQWSRHSTVLDPYTVVQSRYTLHILLGEWASQIIETDTEKGTAVFNEIQFER